MITSLLSIILLVVLVSFIYWQLQYAKEMNLLLEQLQSLSDTLQEKYTNDEVQEFVNRNNAKRI